MRAQARGVGTIYKLRYPPRGTSYAAAKAAGLLKESAVWWIQYSCRGACGQPQCSGRHAESTQSDNRRTAEKLLRKRLGEVGLGKVITAEVEKTTFADLARMIETDYQVNRRKSGERLKYSLKHLRQEFGTSRALGLTTDRIKQYTADRLKAHAKPATVQNELAALKRMFTLAMQAGKVAQRPYIPSLHIRNARQGFFEEPQFQAVLDHLPDYLKPVMTFCYLTGWRKHETLTLTWDNVDFRAQELRLEPGTTKNDEGRTFPFSVLPPLRDVLYAQRERTAQEVPWVFHHNGRSLKDYYSAWRQACAAAKVPGKLVHDLRRTAVRNLERAGVPRSVAMKLTGHKTETVYRRYAIVSKSDLTEAVEKLAKLHEPRRAVKVQLTSEAVHSLPVRSDVR